MNNVFWIILAFVIYIVFMILIGAFYSRKTQNAEDYFLGGRGLGGWVAAMSAQASDMSGWLLMGLPGSIYMLGTGELWVSIGLFLGTLLNWILVAGRLRRYTIRANNSVTLPEYFENRFHDTTKSLILVSAIVFVVFFLVYTASALSSGAKLFNIVFGLDYKVALLIGTLVILVYTYLGGFMAVCVTDFIQGILMLAMILAVPIILLFVIDPSSISATLDASGVAGGAASYLNLFKSGESAISWTTIVSGLAWGLGYCGMPHILVRFMAIKSEKELKKSRVIANVWNFLALGIISVLAILARVYLFPRVGVLADSENVVVMTVKELFTNQYAIPFLAGILLCAILAAIMSTADSQLLVTASAVSKDIYADVIKKGKSVDEKKILWLSRIVVVVVAVIAFFIAWNPNSSIMSLVSDAWAGLGAAFGPVVVLSLYWKKTTKTGALSGIIAGALTVIIWDYIPFIGGQTIGTVTGLYSLIVGFIIGLVAVIIGSLAGKPATEEMLQEFDDVKFKRVNG
ncbi:MAG: sodium/proline symporter PutP [Lachnospiraceae bacterium]|nr:sodium/proline symporter PutP [Lachnospiraceae bacterium]